MAPNNSTSIQWTRPDHELPVPSLNFLYHLECDLENPRNIGRGPHGDRKVIMFKGGRFEGSRLRGEILPGGGDWLILRDHDGDQQSAHLDTRYNLQTHDGAVIYIQTTGVRTGKKSTAQALGAINVVPEDYKMRLRITAETGDERYSWINQAVIVASAARLGDQVIYDAYEVL